MEKHHHLQHEHHHEHQHEHLHEHQHEHLHEHQHGLKEQIVKIVVTVVLLIAAVLQLYTVVRISSELEKEQKNQTK